MTQTVAHVTYTGRMDSDFRYGPSGRLYKFRNPMGGDPRSLAVNNVEDALHFDGNDVFDMEWTAYGRLARKVGGPIADAKEALKEMSYRQKQSLVSSLSLDVAGNAAEDTMDEALEPMVDDLQRQMENQR